MPKPTGSLRPLFFPLNRSADVESDTPDETIEYIDLSQWQSADNDERVDIVLNLSLNEYISLATAIDAGRDISYGDNSILIWWIWVRSVFSLDICQSVLNCILNNEDIQQAIAGFSGGSNINGESTENQSNLSTELVNNPALCDNDIIFGMTLQLVEFADRLIKDLFEQIGAAQLASVNVGYLIKLIPVIETLPIDEAFQIADKLVNDMETAYLSASTTLLKEEIACDLFCLAVANDCVLTLEMVRDYYQEKANIVFDYTDVIAFMADFISGVFVGNAVFYGMNIFFFQIFAFAGKFLDYFFEDYARTIQAMYNDPNPDWVTLCEECPTQWLWESDFPTEQNIWIPTTNSGNPLAVWTSMVGWTSVDRFISSRYQRICQIVATFTPTKITDIEVTFNLVKGTYVDTNSYVVQIIAVKNNDTTVIGSLLYSASVNGDNQTLLLAVNEPDIKSIIVAVRCNSAGFNSYSGVAKIVNLTINGEDTNPFE